MKIDSVDQCNFYHSTDIPGVGHIEGQWSLSEGLDEYLGGYDFSGKRVLEIGPAAGLLTFQIEKTATEVEKQFHEHIGHIRNGFWFCHEKFGSNARFYLGSAENLPDTLGEFDVVLLASILLHSRPPVAILESCARLGYLVAFLTTLFHPVPGSARFHRAQGELPSSIRG